MQHTIDIQRCTWQGCVQKHFHYGEYSEARNERHTCTHNRFAAHCPGLPRRAGTRRNTHSLFLLINFLHPPRSGACSLLNVAVGQSFRRTSSPLFLAYLWVWILPLHTPCSYHRKAHTIVTCFTVVSRLYPVFLVCLSSVSYTHLTLPTNREV